MEDLKIDRDKLFALEILNELEDSYINKINEGTNRDNIEPQALHGGAQAQLEVTRC